MRRFILVAALAAAVAPAAASAGVSVEAAHPGFYGRIEIGGFPIPRPTFPEPVIIERVHVSAPPIYLHVPARTRKGLGGASAPTYDACGHRVFFVQEAWYNDVSRAGLITERSRWQEGPGQGRQEEGPDWGTC